MNRLKSDIGGAALQVTRDSGGIVISEERRRFLNRRLESAIREQPEIKTLRDSLLRIGGCELVAPEWTDSQISELIQAGFVMDGYVTLTIMEPCACHRNISLLWKNKRRKLTGIGTGYALSGDGLWRQHSWGVTRRGIIETTERRSKYFGQLLCGTNADMFAACNS
jgi:hypothetical protein